MIVWTVPPDVVTRTWVLLLVELAVVVVEDGEEIEVAAELDGEDVVADEVVGVDVTALVVVVGGVVLVVAAVVAGVEAVVDGDALGITRINTGLHVKPAPQTYAADVEELATVTSPGEVSELRMGKCCTHEGLIC